MHPIPWVSLNRGWQKGIFTLLILLEIFLGILGIYTLQISPALSFGSDLPLSLWGPNIQGIEGIGLDPAFFKGLPEFFAPEEEARWWRMQERVYRALEGKGSVRIALTDQGGAPRGVEAAVGPLPLLDVIKKMGLIYLVALVYLIGAVSVFQRHRSTPGSLLAFFLLFVALYLTSNAPVATRSLTLYPPGFKTLIRFTHFSAGGMITLVHFAWVFPRPKEALQRFPALPSLLYGYFLVTVVLYLSGITAFGTTFPLFCLWVLVMIGALLHSLLREEDLFLREQIRLSLLAPLMMGSIFVLLYLLPGVVGIASMKFTYLALFSLILPYALPSAIENLRLHRERLEIEQRSHREKEQLRRDLHDGALKDLGTIFTDAEGALTLLEEDIDAVREMLRSIADRAGDGAQRLRDFLWIGEGHLSWEDFCAHLRKCGDDLLNHREIDFDLELSGGIAGLELPSLSIRVCLYLVFQEALLNVARHSRAGRVRASFSGDGDTAVILEIEDDGQGFDPEKIGAGHYGLRFMQERVEDHGGTFHLETEPLRGTRIKVWLPLKNPPFGG